MVLVATGKLLLNSVVPDVGLLMVVVWGWIVDSVMGLLFRMLVLVRSFLRVNIDSLRVFGLLRHRLYIDLPSIRN